MGLTRFASRRHPHVVVMAPALTETGQTQSFTNLPNLLDACEFPLPKPKIKSQEIGIAVYNRPASADECLKTPNGKIGKRASPFRPLDIQPSEGDSSMNFGSPMGDQPENMGQLKSASTCSLTKESPPTPLPIAAAAAAATTTEITSSTTASATATTNNMANLPFIKEKDMEQYLEQMPPNVDELMRVIKTMDFEGQDNTEFPLSTVELSSFEKELLFNPEDVISNFADEPPDIGPDPRIAVTREREEEARRRDWQLERKHSRLMRRMKKLEAREVAKESAAGLTGVFQHAYRLARPAAADALNDLDRDHDHSLNLPLPPPSPASASATASAAATTSATATPQPQPTRADLEKFAEKLHCSAHTLAQTATRFRPGIRYFGSGSVESPQTADPAPGSVVPKLSTTERDSLNAVASQLSTQLGIADAEFDSDATDSSSGGDSCDETVNYNNNLRNFLSIKKRAYWRWHQDRSSVACRWTWLTTQITDLDFRVRQLTDHHKRHRSEKTPVILKNGTSPSLNGYQGLLPGAGHVKAEGGPNGTVSPASFDPAAISTCTRTTPFIAQKFRKRDLIRWDNLHLRAENHNVPSAWKVLRPASTRCWCIKPAHCLLCTGRTDATQPKGWPSVRVASVQERIAALDPSYHPVLSFTDDVPLSLHLESVMRLNEWQTRINRCSYKYGKYNKYPKEKNNSSVVRLKKDKLEQKRKIHKHATDLLSAKLKKKVTAGQRKRRDMKSLDHYAPIPPIKIKKARKISSKSGAESGDDGDLYVTTVPLDSGRVSPELNNLGFSFGGLADEKRRGGREDSFDINNIVIPYSIAATTRVEMLPYKEIPTPKWRVMDENGEESALFVESSDEDVSEQAVQDRHSRCEEVEKRHFSSYIKLPLVGRGRANRRTDSRAESSGANTPDPMSPMNLDHGDSPLATPPATPQGADDVCAIVQSNSARRRTISSSRAVLRDKLERFDHEQHFIIDAEDEVLPYERRLYPLEEEELQVMLTQMPGSPVSAPDGEQAAYHCAALPDSPSSSSTISAVEGDEPDDPNDPEWQAADDEEEEDLKNHNRR